MTTTSAPGSATTLGPSESGPTQSPAAFIIGVTLGGVVFLAILAVASVCIWKRCYKPRKRPSQKEPQPTPDQPQPWPTPPQLSREDVSSPRELDAEQRSREMPAGREAHEMDPRSPPLELTSTPVKELPTGKEAHELDTRPRSRELAGTSAGRESGAPI